MNWMGIRVVKYEQDLMALQEIMWRVKPNVVIETGARFGGSTLFYAHMMDIMKIDGMVLSVDITDQEYIAPVHPKIHKLLGSSLANQILDTIDAVIKTRIKPVVLVNLDSDHTAEFVIQEMEAYYNFVTKGSYLIIEDTNQQGPRLGNFAFLAKHPEFIPDKSIEPAITTNPNGFLLRT